MKISSGLVKYFKYNIKGYIVDGPVVHLSFIVSRHPLINIFIRRSHPNVVEFECIVSALRKLSSRVVVTDYRYDGADVGADVVVGFGRAAGVSAGRNDKFLYYATGASAVVQNKSTLDEGNYVKDKYGISLDKLRHCLRISEPDTACVENIAKNVMLIGNSWTGSTFCDKNIIGLINGIPLKCIYENKVHVKNNGILWVGSKGAIHKGIHIAAEVAKQSNMKLYVIGVLDQEKSIVEYLLKIIGCEYELYGFIDVGGVIWKNIVKRCSYVLGCSVSEGMSTGILTAIVAGLFPITTDSCGINYGEIVKFNERVDLVNKLVDKLEFARDSGYTKKDFLLNLSEQVAMECSSNNFKRSVSNAIFNFWGNYVNN